MLRTIVLFTLVAVICSGCSKNSGVVGSTTTIPQAPQSSGSPARPPQTLAGELRYRVPEGWKAEKPTSDMRAAQYKLPKAGSDSEDALLILYYFGQGQGGSAQANIDRWINQIQQPDGQPSKERAKTGTMIVNGLEVNTVDLTGHYSGGMSPDSAPVSKDSIYRLRAAVIETPKGSYFVKLTGPEKTIAHWDEAYTEYIKSFEFK